MACFKADRNATARASAGTKLHFPGTLPRGHQLRRAYFWADGAVTDEPASRNVGFRHSARVKSGTTVQGLSTGIGKRGGGQRILFEAVVNGNAISGGRAESGAAC